MNQINDTASLALLSAEPGFDPIEERLRSNVRATIEAVFEEELASFLGRLRYDVSGGHVPLILGLQSSVCVMWKRVMSSLRSPGRVHSEVTGGCA